MLFRSLITWYDTPLALTSKDKDETAFAIYPNPSKGIFNIRVMNAPDKKFEVEVMDVVGNVVKQFAFSSTQTSFDLSKFAKGVYTVKISSDKKTEFKKLIVQ